MSELLLFLCISLPLGFVVFRWMRLRGQLEQARRREAAFMAEMLALRGAPAPLSAMADVAGAANVEAHAGAELPPDTPQRAAARIPQRQYLLDKVERAVYARLRTELPACRLLPKVDPMALLSRVDTPPPRRAIDLLICRRDFSPIAAVLLVRHDDPLRPRLAAALGAAGVTVVEWQPERPPAASSLRGLID